MRAYFPAKYNPTRRRKDDTSDDEITSLVDQARTDVITKQIKVIFSAAQIIKIDHIFEDLIFAFVPFKVGLDIITDGEIERETYYLHLGRNLKGIDFDNVKEKEGRNGACTFNAPIVKGKLELKVCGNKIAYLKKVQI